MKFFVIPYLLAVDLVVPSGRFDYKDYKPTFFFHVRVNSSAHPAIDTYLRTDYVLETIMSCTPDPISLWCCFKDTMIRHGHTRSAHQTNDDDRYATMITDEQFLLEFDETGVKISGCKEKSERSLRMVQKIVDLLNVDVDFDGDERRGSSKLETVTLVEGCPVETTADLRRPNNVEASDSSSRRLENGFFKLTSHPDDFDETSGAVWSLDVNRTKNIAKCKNFQDFFFGSRGQEDVLHGYRLVSNVTSSIVRMRITNDNFTSTGYTEGTMTSRTMKFIAKDEINVSIGLGDIYVPAL